MTTLKVFLFDVDGVLIQNDNWTKNIEKDCGITVPQLQEFFEKDFEACLENRADLKIALESWLIRWGYKYNVEDFLKYWFEADSILNQEVFDLSKGLSETHPCYLATNQEKYRAEYLMNTLNFGAYFRSAFTACGLGVAKPQRDFFAKTFQILKKLHPEIQPGNICFIDDSFRNVSEAAKNGWTAHHFENSEKLRTWVSSCLQEADSSPHIPHKN